MRAVSGFIFCSPKIPRLPGQLACFRKSFIIFITRIIVILAHYCAEVAGGDVGSPNTRVRIVVQTLNKYDYKTNRPPQVGQ